MAASGSEQPLLRISAVTTAGTNSVASSQSISVSPRVIRHAT